MKCEQLQDQFVEYLLSELSDREEAAIEQHLRNRCRQCELELKRVQEGIELLAEAAPRADMSEKQIDTLVCRAKQAAMPRMEIALGRDVAVDSWDWLNAFRIGQYAASLAAGILLVLLLTRDDASSRDAAIALHPNESSLPSIPAKAGSNSAQVLGLEQQRSVQGKFSFVSLEGRSVNPQGIGFAVVDEVSGELHFLAKRVPSPPPGSQYVLWIVSLESEVRIPLIREANGFCKAIVPLPVDPVRHIEVRFESLDGTTQAVDNEALMSADIEA